MALTATEAGGHGESPVGLGKETGNTLTSHLSRPRMSL